MTTQKGTDSRMIRKWFDLTFDLSFQSLSSFQFLHFSFFFTSKCRFLYTLTMFFSFLTLLKMIIMHIEIFYFLGFLFYLFISDIIINILHLCFIPHYIYVDIGKSFKYIIAVIGLICVSLDFFFFKHKS